MFDALAEANYTEFVEPLMAPDPGGLQARTAYREYPIDYGTVPISASPPTSWLAGRPLPGPYATAFVQVDNDSAQWWGVGCGVTYWESPTLAVAVSPIPTDMAEHVETFDTFAGGYPSIGRNPPTAFGNTVPLFRG